MKVYVEYVLIDNFLIDYMLLKATFATTGKPVSRKRLFLVSALGATFALLLPLIEGVYIVGTLYKTFSGLLIVLLSSKHFTFREYYITTLTFFALTFLTGGAIIGVSEMLKIDYSSEPFIALIFAPVYLLIKIIGAVIRYFSRRNSVQTFLYKVKIINGKVEEIVQGFLDSGNTVYEGGLPVIFCTKSLAKKLILECSLKNPPFKIEIVTVSGRAQKTAFKISALEIYLGEKKNIFKGVTVCVADDSAFNGYQLILHPALFEERKDNEQSDEQIKEVS